MDRVLDLAPGSARRIASSLRASSVAPVGVDLVVISQPPSWPVLRSTIAAKLPIE